ncbi:RAxF-45 family protein [Bacillus solimangrovi]|nr:RAxF-45 family protein [Bacillus solimangrovi]
MSRSVMLRKDEISFLYLCRAIFHGAVKHGISMSFFSNCICKTER